MMASDRHTGVTTPDPVRGEECSVRQVLDRLGDTWSLLVLTALERRPRRFLELLRTVEGVSQRMLTLTLRRLERDGLVDRVVHDTRPPTVVYSLTDLGRSLAPPVRALATWARDHGAEIAERRSAWDARHGASAR